MIKNYRKKPIVIQAIQWSGNNFKEILNFDGSNRVKISSKYPGSLEIETLEGVMLASPWDYIIKGVKGEIYPCKQDVFLKTYDEIK